MKSRLEVRTKLISFLSNHKSLKKTSQREIAHSVDSLLRDITIKSDFETARKRKDYARTLRTRREGCGGFCGPKLIRRGPVGTGDRMLSLGKYGKENMGFGGNTVLSSGTMVVAIHDQRGDTDHWPNEHSYANKYGVAIVRYYAPKYRNEKGRWSIIVPK